jgi:tetratricopeptide (TPR) repeat protein
LCKQLSFRKLKIFQKVNSKKNCLILFFIILTANATAQQTIQKKELTPEERELYIQKANQYRKEENYVEAIKQLDTVLTDNPADAGILLFKGDLKLQSNLFTHAVTIYKQLLQLNFEPTITRINLSYALFMNHQPVKALQFAKMAWLKDSSNPNAVVNYFNAMLWNMKTKKAGLFLQQQQQLLTHAQVLVLKARLYTTSGDYRSGLQVYDSLVKKYPDKFYAQEYAEVLLGKKEIQQSKAIVKKHDSLFSANEYNVLQQKIKAAQQQNAGTEFLYFKDVAKNIRIENTVWWQQRDGVKYRFRLSAGISAITSAQNEKTKAQFGHIHIDERWSKSWSGQTDIHLQLIQPSSDKSFSGFTGKQTVQYQPNDRRMIGLSYSADILNYTAALLGKNIRSNSLGYVTHILITGKTGFFSQGSWALLNDKNQCQQFFGSLYHLFRTTPTLKTGLNFSAVHYKDNSIKTYFSPEKYFSTEAFIDYSMTLPALSKCYLQLQAAAGMQKIENQKWDPAYRLQTEIGIRLNHLETALKYQTSNVASSTGTGYKFNWFTLRLMWKW